MPGRTDIECPDSPNAGAGDNAWRLRSTAVTAIREFFANHDFLEVDTPLLVAAPGSEATLDPIQVTESSGIQSWLISSPEHHMKRLLCDGAERIYQICRCFRGGEHSPHHRVEFTMVEWYRRDADYLQIARDVEQLVACVSGACLGSVSPQGQNGLPVDLSSPWPQWTVADAISQFAGIELTDPGDVAGLRRAALDAGMSSIGPEDDWESAFYKILIERVEPSLAHTGRGVHLLDWPAPMAALSRLRSDDPTVAERVESYAGGLELSNGFSELTDPREQRRRFREERLRRRQRGSWPLPVDEAFLRALAMGMPRSAGVALGLDRLMLLVSPHSDLRHLAPHVMENRGTE